ncbi:amidohydrolase family protein [Paenibacillus sp. MBLB4367]|uniref:amidohydrolase family protein n=1 Tax=Paenibacillus sp. MBLB4367 TaxID=3384767 RepID=UPI003907FA8A
MNKWIRTFSILALITVVALLGLSEYAMHQRPGDSSVSKANKVPDDKADLYQKYKNLGLTDVHNHDAWKYPRSLSVWNKYHIAKIVLFGSVSNRAALKTDRMSWNAYRKYPERIYPFFSGFDMYQPEGLQTVRDNLEQGYLGIGETYAASSNTPGADKREWKGKNAMDGNLPKIYEICSEYDVPILLHIDPPDGIQLTKLKEALENYPKTKIIFAHANVYNPAAVIDALMENHPNLYIDFFAGFTSYNPKSPYTTDS